MHYAFENMKNHGGGFAQALATAWFRADSINRVKIQTAFPELIRQYTIWDWSKIDNVSVAGIDPKDAPDYCDAYIESCDIDGHAATDYELERINENRDFVYKQVESHVY